eukprot:6185860-Pleurochrysis_carterae.AAC.3
MSAAAHFISSKCQSFYITCPPPKHETGAIFNIKTLPTKHDRRVKSVARLLCSAGYPLCSVHLLLILVVMAYALPVPLHSHGKPKSMTY